MIPNQFCVAAFCGQLAHASYSHGNFTKIVARNSHHSLGVNVTKAGWDSFLFISQEIKIELDLCKDFIDFFNGAPIRLSCAFVSVFYPSQRKYLIENVSPHLLQYDPDIFVSDASQTAAFSFKAGSLDYVNEYLFDVDQQSFSSGLRELIAIISSFKAYPNYFKSKRNQPIIWMTDSYCVYSFLTKGSRSMKVQSFLIQLKRLEYEYGCFILPKWLRRNEPLICLADLGSKLSLSTDEFGLSHLDFIFIQDYFGVTMTCDSMASHLNRRCEKYISVIPQQDNYALDFFTTNLSENEVYYIHPPVKMIASVINKLSACKNIRAYLVVPSWLSYSFFVLLLEQDCFKSFISNYLLFNPLYVNFAKSSVFKGYKTFQTLVVEINTSVLSNIKNPYVL